LAGGRAETTRQPSPAMCGARVASVWAKNGSAHRRCMPKNHPHHPPRALTHECSTRILAGGRARITRQPSARYVYGAGGANIGLPQRRHGWRGTSAGQAPRLSMVAVWPEQGWRRSGNRAPLVEGRLDGGRRRAGPFDRSIGSGGAELGAGFSGPAAEAQSVMGSAGPVHVEPVIVPMLEVTGAVTDLQAGEGKPVWRDGRKSDRARRLLFSRGSSSGERGAGPSVRLRARA
jgi:hypothetical protein